MSIDPSGCIIGGMLALLYDVHGNLPALEAVVADAEAAGAEGFLLGGDYAGLGAWPQETLARLGELPVELRIRGNWERWLARPEEAVDDDLVRAASEWCRERIGAAAVAELAALPEQAVRDGTRYCHGSPVSDMRSFLPEPAEDEAELLAGVSERRVVFGHTHLQFRRLSLDGIDLVNPGSVGLPFDGDHRAAYAVLDDDGEIELRRITYDHLASAAAVRERMGAWALPLAGRLERAAF
jgi:diadenosine tetraphosphatase ApaH/serine/threonine PP2A family protein phosphatase